MGSSQNAEGKQVKSFFDWLFGRDTQNMTQKRVIVIGAGIAGLAAAQKLKAAGFAVTVLEARDRVGGRILTSTNSAGTTVDLGAAWIHGNQAEFEALVAGMTLPTANSDWTKYKFHTANGPTTLTQAQFDELTFKIADACLWAAWWAPSWSLKTVIDVAWNNGDFAGYPRELVDNFAIAGLDTEFAYTATKIPARAVLELIPGFHDAQQWAAFTSSKASDNTYFPGGFGQVATQLAQGLDIRLNEVVTGVDYSGPGVWVQTTVGAKAAEHLIVTVPIGVLKAGSITFSPSLPLAKQNAIARLGNGRLEKVILEWNPADQFWPDGASAPHVLGMHSTTRGLYSTWINLQPVRNKPMLQAWLSGDAANIELLTDAAVEDAAMARIRATIAPNAAEPISCTVTRWGEDPYARGSYSTFRMETHLGDRALLREPVANNRVLFAGEATLDTGFATVPGAYTSGIREADRLIQLYGGTP